MLTSNEYIDEIDRLVIEYRSEYNYKLMNKMCQEKCEVEVEVDAVQWKLSTLMQEQYRLKVHGLHDHQVLAIVRSSMGSFVQSISDETIIEFVQREGLPPHPPQKGYSYSMLYYAIHVILRDRNRCN